jgi:molecular chaperone DnaK
MLEISVVRGATVGYQLGIDLGAENTVVAVIDGGWPEVMSIGGASAIPPALHLGPGGEVRAGRAALRRARTEPDGLATGFIAQLGDGTPLLVGAAGHTAESLLARFLNWIIETAVKAHGDAPDRVVVAHPTSWASRRREALVDACARIEAIDVPVVTATAAGATAALLTRQGRSRPGEYLGVYDLGPASFEAFVLGAMPGGFRVAGVAAGLSSVGTDLFDRIMFAHVLRAAGVERARISRPGGPAPDLTDSPEGQRLLADCGQAVDVLAEEETVDVVVPAALTGGGDAAVAVSRAEFQALLGPTVEDTIRATERSIRSVPAEPGDLSVLIVRGSGARAPLVAPRLAEAFSGIARHEIRSDLDVALGAAILAADAVKAESSRARTVLIGRPALDPPPSVPPPGVGSWPPVAAAAGVGVGAGAAADQTALLAKPPAAAGAAPAVTDATAIHPAPAGQAAAAAATTAGPVAAGSAPGAAAGAGGASGGRGGSSSGHRGRGGLRSPRLIAAAAVLLLFAASAVTIGLVVTGGGSSSPQAVTTPLASAGPVIDTTPTASASVPAPTGPNVIISDGS